MIRAALLACCLAGPLAADPVQEAMQDYADFAPYNAGVILPEQITSDIFPAITFIDTRRRDDFEAGTIEGAQHIEWREVFGRLEEIPQTGKVVLFCNTGTVSAQATFGLRVLGRENVLVLQGGYGGWQTRAGTLAAD